MKIRYRNRSTGEARDISVGSAEEATVKTEVYTVNGESLPLWVLDAEYAVLMEEEKKMSDLMPIFGHSSRRLTPGERAMGIESYEQKVRENTADAEDFMTEEDEDDEFVSTTDIDASTGEYDDEEDDESPAPATASPASHPRRAPRRAPAKSR